MFKVGITGGIGSGKSMVCQVFQALGIPVFDADKAAKFLMTNDASLVASIKELLGNDAYKNEQLNRSFIASKVFSNPSLLQALNKLVHPAVFEHSKQWLEAQTAQYVIKEAALFFESNSFKEMDFIIGVFAPENLRIQRAMQRDGLSEAAILERMNNQMDEKEKMKRCDQVIVNENETSVLSQVLSVHKELIKIASR